MRWVVVVMLVQVAHAAPAKVRGDELQAAAANATTELAACARLAGGAVGDVVIDGSWVANPSKSFGANAPAIAACVRAAVKAHYQALPTYDGSSAPRMMIGEPITIPIGAPTQVLPPIPTLLPVWHRALEPSATQADRDALARVLPPDYAVAGRCVKTDRAYAQKLEPAWFAGLRTIANWRAGEVGEMAAHRHGTTWIAVWDGAGLITGSADGICTEPFDPIAARAVFDRAGSCWVGSPTEVLFDPRVEFPAGTYVQVATRNGRTCALDAHGAMTCCGRNDRFGAPPSVPLRQLALANEYACGLDDAGRATCWGGVTTAPKRPFTKLVGGRNGICGLHADGAIECMASSKPPRGTFVDVAISDGICGLRPDGSVECWNRDGRSPPGRWSHLAMGFPDLLCGLRHDQSVGCAHLGYEAPMSTPTAQAWTQLAVTATLGACGIRRDGTLACSDLQQGVIASPGTPPPPGTFTQITADEDQYCALRTTGGIACWGNSWPPRAVVPPQQPPSFHGAIVDERGAPIAGASIELDRKGTIAANADGTWQAALPATHIWVKITAPGRESTDRYGDRAALAAPIALRPAATVNVEATCDGRPCWSMVERGRSGHLVDSKLESVAPGSYWIRVWRDHGERTEQLAVVDFTMPFAAVPMTLHPALVATGTGHTLRGTLSPGSLAVGARVELRCANGALRTVVVEADDRGRWELRNVPALPCELVAGSAVTGEVTVDLTSYADQHLVLRGL